MKTHLGPASSPHAPGEKKSAARSQRKSSVVSPRMGNGEDRDELVRKTAYQLYEARSRGEGHALDDWLQAEAQLAGSRA